MFNVIYLVSGGKPGDSTNILVTDAYRWAFERGERYGMAAAYGDDHLLDPAAVDRVRHAHRAQQGRRRVTRAAPRSRSRSLAHVALIVLVAVVLYPVMLVCKKAFEPGRQLRAVGVADPDTTLTLDHFRDLFGARGGHGELLFLRHALELARRRARDDGRRRARCRAPRRTRCRGSGSRAARPGLTDVPRRADVPGDAAAACRSTSILDKLGLLNSIAGLVLVYATTAIPFCVWTLKGYFDSLPRELEEAARIDGASPWLIFRRIILPLARPGIAVTALFSFMTAWNEFIMASTFMTDESRYTLPVLIQSSVGEYSADWGLFAAGAIVTSMPVMVAFYVLQRYLVGGLTAGAVKG